jgi:hypothetical protein
MKHIYILSFLMVSFCYSQNTSTDNFLSNGDFENGLTGYNTNNANYLTATVETTVVNPNTGSTSSVKLVSGGLTGTQAGVFKPQAGNTVLGGGDEGNYLFSFWAKSETANQKIQARYVAAGGVYVKTNLMTFTDTNWHKVQFNRSDIPAGKEVQFQIVFTGADMANQTFYIDDMKVSQGQVDTDMDLSYYEIFRAGPSPANVPASGLDQALWASQNFNGTNQVSSLGYSDVVKNSAIRSLKVSTKASTTSEAKAVVQPKENGTQEIRFATPSEPTVGGSSDDTTYPEIKYTFSMKVRSNVQGAQVNVNYKIAGVNKFGTLATLNADEWTDFTVSHIVDRAPIAGKTQWQHLPVLQMNTPNADFYFDDINISWQEWDESTMSTPIQDYTNVVIYPNPAEHFIMIDGVDYNTNVDIYDISGKIVKSFTFESKSQQIDVSDLVKGIYLARLNNEQTTLFIKK